MTQFPIKAPWYEILVVTISRINHQLDFYILSLLQSPAEQMQGMEEETLHGSTILEFEVSLDR